MTITSTQNRVTYAGNGAPGVPGTLVFAVPFRFLQPSDLVVLVRVDATGVDTTKTLDTHYSVAGEGAAAGGTVTFLIEDGEPQTGETLIIYGNPPMTQTIDFQSGDPFPAETHEEALDKLTLQGTRTREIAERALSLTDSSTDGSGEYDANGNRISSLGTPTATTDATTKTYVDVLVNNTALGPAPTGLIATGSVTSRLLADRWADTINVKDFGAVGNGVVDDTEAIQDAFDAAGSDHPVTGGGDTYNITGQLLIGASATFTLRDITLSHSGTGTDSALLISGASRGPTVYTETYMENVYVVSNSSSALIGIETKKALRSTWINVRSTGFDAAGAVGCTLEGSTSNRFFNCTFSSNTVGLKTLNFVQSGPAYIPANENKFFGCNFNLNTSDGVWLSADARPGGGESTGNGNSFTSCWIEDNGGIGFHLENSLETRIIDCRFETNTGYNVKIIPTEGTVRRHTRIMFCQFIGLVSPLSHLYIGANAEGTNVQSCTFSGGGVTTWEDLGTQSIFFANTSDGIVQFEHSVGTYEELDNAGTLTTASATIDNLKLTSRPDGNNWTDVAVVGNAITFSTTLAKCSTTGTTIDRIEGGTPGDYLILGGNEPLSGSTTSLVSGGNITQLPTGVTCPLAYSSTAVLVCRGFDTWLLVSYNREPAQTYTTTNTTEVRSFDADTVAVEALADVVGTLVADLKVAGIVK